MSYSSEDEVDLTMVPAARLYAVLPSAVVALAEIEEYFPLGKTMKNAALFQTSENEVCDVECSEVRSDASVAECASVRACVAVSEPSAVPTEPK